jgi:hypothetical protein
MSSSLVKVLIVAFAAAAAAAPHPNPSSSPAPVATAAPPAPPSAADTKALYQDLLTSPSALGRFQRLLVDKATGGLLPPAALKPKISFDYVNGATLNPGDKGGKLTAAVAGTFPILTAQDISTVAAFLNPCR